MKISELINALEKIKDEHGDIDVCCWPYDGQDRRYSPKLSVIVIEEETLPFVEIDGI